MQAAFQKCEGSHLFLESHVNELAFAIIEDIVITNQMILLHLVAIRWVILPADKSFSNRILGVRETVGNEREGNADNAFLNEVHFGDILFFVVNYFVFVGVFEVAGEEAEGNVIEEVHLVLRVELEEASKFEENILEKIYGHYLSFDFDWKLFEVLVDHAGKAIVGLVVLKVIFNLGGQVS